MLLSSPSDPTKLPSLITKTFGCSLGRCILGQWQSQCQWPRTNEVCEHENKHIIKVLMGFFWNLLQWFMAILGCSLYTILGFSDVLMYFMYFFILCMCIAYMLLSFCNLYILLFNCITKHFWILNLYKYHIYLSKIWFQV
jgi:hypothetical protein